MTYAPLDLAGVPARKLEEARKRAAVIAEYLKLERPTKALAEAFAARLGIKVRLFYILVKIYRERGTVVRSENVGLANRALQLDPAVNDAISRAIATLGPTAKLADVLADASARCAGLGLPRPTLVAVRTRLARARRECEGSQCYPELVLDRTPLVLNVMTDHGPVAAWLTALIHSPTARVLGHHVSAGDAGPRDAMVALLDAMPAEEAAGPAAQKAREILVIADSQPGWAEFSSFLGVVGCAPSERRDEHSVRGAALMRLLGDRIERIQFRPRLRPGRPAPKGGPGVDLDTAREAVRSALEARANRQRVGPTQGCLTPSSHTSSHGANSNQSPW